MKSMFENQKEEFLQKQAWRLVRSAEDRFGAGKGAEKRTWCVDKLIMTNPKETRDFLEDHIRSAYMVFKIETKAVKL